MINLLRDVNTMMWKDLKASLRANRGIGGVFYLSFWALLFGVALPLVMGSAWLTSPEVLFIWAWLPFYVVTPILGGAVAGERELHTLETLLATRLPDLAILLGKIAAGALYGWVYALFSILCGPLLTALAAGQPLHFYSPAITVGGPVISLLGAVAGAGIGVLISLRSATNREAQDGIGMALMLLTIPVATLRVGFQEMGVSVAGVLLSVNGWVLNMALGTVLGLISLIVVWIASMRFVRARLLLD